jgi:hypothetical protein
MRVENTRLRLMHSLSVQGDTFRGREVVSGYLHLGKFRHLTKRINYNPDMMRPSHFIMKRA